MSAACSRRIAHLLGVLVGARNAAFVRNAVRAVMIDFGLVTLHIYADAHIVAERLLGLLLLHENVERLAKEHNRYTNDGNNYEYRLDHRLEIVCT